ncbi:hypothetical protein V2J09_022137 [Rumex salicifolius]
MNLLEKIKMHKEPEKAPPPLEAKVWWVEKSESVCCRFQFEPDGQLSIKMLKDVRPLYDKVVESFLGKFFPAGYPYSVNEGYLRYTQFRALQHFTSAALSVLSTQSLLFAAGLRPTPAQATVVSWILKDGMQHAGKLICSNLGSVMDSEPKCWRILGRGRRRFLLGQSYLKSFPLYLALELLCFGILSSICCSADVLYDLGTGLEVISPLCPQLFLEMAGLGNFAKGMATVAARATRLPLYSSFAKEGNLSDLFAKGEAISTLFNVAGLGVGIQLASTVCSSTQGKMIVGPLLSVLHIYSVVEEMRAVPVNTLNSRRLGMVVANFIKKGKISSPADLRYQEDLLPGRLIEEAGNVRVGKALHKAIPPSKLRECKEMFPDEKFLLSPGKQQIDMVLEHDATAEDALRGWLVAAYAKKVSGPANDSLGPADLFLAYEQMEGVYPELVSELQKKGWHTDRFLDGTGKRNMHSFKLNKKIGKIIERKQGIWYMPLYSLMLMVS